MLAENRRFLAVIPVVMANFVAPKLFCRGLDATTIMLVAFNTMWLASFKAGCGTHRWLAASSLAELWRWLGGLTL